MDAVLRIFRGDREAGGFENYTVPQDEGMVVLDAVHYVQAHLASDLACRWSCKAGKCGSCGAGVNGKARLRGMARMGEGRRGARIASAAERVFPGTRGSGSGGSRHCQVRELVTA